MVTTCPSTVPAATVPAVAAPPPPPSGPPVAGLGVLCPMAVRFRPSTAAALAATTVAGRLVEAPM
eukprot:scaffold8157_cov45-Phaeocystis_antarctica.AAC.2